MVEWNVVAEDDCARSDRRNRNNGIRRLGPIARCDLIVCPALKPHGGQGPRELVKIAVARKVMKPRVLAFN